MKNSVWKKTVLTLILAFSVSTLSLNAQSSVIDPQTLPVRDVMALTLLMEARGEGEEGMTAVACVIVNRFNADNRYKSLKDVCLKPYQFEVWNKPLTKRKMFLLCKEPTAQTAYSIVDRFMSGERVSNPVGYATHYHSGAKPWWADKMELVTVIGGHRFYKEQS